MDEGVLPVGEGVVSNADEVLSPVTPVARNLDQIAPFIPPKGSSKKWKLSKNLTVLLIIFIILATLVLIFWFLILPAISDAFIKSVDPVKLRVITEEGYTIYDSTNDYMLLQIKRGSDNLKLEGYQIVFFDEMNAHSVKVLKNDFPNLILSSSQIVVVGFELPEVFNKPTNIRITPIVSGVSNSRISESSLNFGSDFKDVPGGIKASQIDVSKDGEKFLVELEV